MKWRVQTESYGRSGVGSDVRVGVEDEGPPLEDEVGEDRRVTGENDWTLKSGGSEVRTKRESDPIGEVRG